MNRENSTSLTEKSKEKPERRYKVDLMIKFNPSVVFEVCSACDEDMKLEYQRPFCLFAPNGTEPICWSCGKEIAPDYIRILQSFYYPTGEPYEPFEPLEDLRRKDEARIIRLKKQKRDSLINDIISKGFTKEQLEFLVETSTTCCGGHHDDLPF